MPKVILHIDMNSYFASVEQQANPLLRGKPVGVCAYLPKTKHGNGCIIASSIEAKKVGIKTGMRIADAKKIYPGIILVQNEPAKYRDTTEIIFGILGQYTDQVEPYSIDEAFLDLTGWVANLSQAEKLGQEIQHRITVEAGEWLRASIGIAHTRWLAKFGSDIAPKGGTLLIAPDNVEKIFSSVRITEAWGIKQPTAWRLWQLGITTLNELRHYPVANLLATLGKPGYYLWANVNGIELDGVAQTPAAPKSIGHSYCIPKRTSQRSYLRPILAKLCERTGRRLRAQQLEANGIMAYCGIVHGHGVGGSKRLPSPLFTTPDIFRQADALLFSRPLPDIATMVAVSVFGLTPLSQQQSLFTDILTPKRVACTLDAINDKYGEHAVATGAMWGTGNNAPDRVGYRKTVAVPQTQPAITYIPDFA
ncbi:MAG: DNA polymerase IV [Patescibacteria group bacterium]|nr:DNA polymerase IV [Patescibacteria group bacterium]